MSISWKMEKCLHSVDQIELKREILDGFMYYFEKEWHSPSTWAKVTCVAQTHSLSIPNIPNETSDEVDYHLINQQYSPSSSKVNWDDLFRGLALHTATGITTAYGNFRSQDFPLYDELFWIETFKRVEIQNSTDLIKVVCEAADISLMGLKEFFDRIPQDWKNLLSVKQAVSNGAMVICKRFCLQLDNNRRFQLFPLQLLHELAGTHFDPIDVCIAGLAELTEALDSDRLFKLLGLLALRLKDSEAKEVISFALTLFEQEVQGLEGYIDLPDAADTPSNLPVAISRLLWATLGAPERDLRWRAAHAVRLASALGQSVLIDSLVEMNNSKSAGCFVNSTFVFYHLHARLYLLIALSRAAIDKPDQFRTHVEVFVDVALNQQHVLIRHFAAQVALAVLSKSENLDEELFHKLQNVNMSPISSVQEEQLQESQYLSVSQSATERETEDEQDDKEEKYFFNMDIESYWFPGLSRCFAVDIKKRVAELIINEWGSVYNGRWAVDARRYRDREFYHSHGSYPKTDDLSFYLSYHGMMIVAGQLLASQPVVVDSFSQSSDKFQNWLHRYLLTRKDGHWLADRVDPTHPEDRTPGDNSSDSNWLWSIGQTHFAEFFGLTHPRKTLWGDWNRVDGDRIEEIEVRSALVSSDRSEFLLAACQTSPADWSYRLPAFDDDDRSQIDVDGFTLRGWVNHSDSPDGLDRFDPWSGRIQFPPLQPAPEFCQQLKIVPDSEYRVWSKITDGVEEQALWSSVWGNWEVDDRQAAAHGQRLQASDSFVMNLVQTTQMDLIVKVTISREHRQDYYYREKTDEEEIGRLQPSCKFFLIGQNGVIRSYSERYRTREEASPRA